MAQGCLKCLKFVMCIANLFCFVCGVSVIGLGVYMMMTLHEFTLLMINGKVAHMLLISGIVITCISFLGFLGALKENRCLLLMYFLLLFLLMLVELTAACLLLMYEDQIAPTVEKELTEQLKKARGQAGNSTSERRDLVQTQVSGWWDPIQTQLDCCGVYNVSDWKNEVPKSCCQTTCDVPKLPYREKGCFDALKTQFEDNFLNIGISVIVICIVEVLGMCFAMTLFCHISRSGLGYKL
ncbi:leukocyte surface antigen CD53-like [Solea solea]|uniref:leukocyte surface antigen CD53-like n=1 Tax=Solea solea TaxID=90069 RepID=UPI00272BB42F|nr:leukocyte surface antigen CD53-like [Solea solea]